MSDHETRGNIMESIANRFETFNTKRFEVGFIGNGERGYFEHHERGDEYGGGLWFDGLTLVDYDGISGYLPAEILDELEARGFDVSDMRPE
jgi:hypothetical protein